MASTKDQILGLPDTAKFWLSYLPTADKISYDGRTVTVDYPPTDAVNCDDVCEGVGDPYGDEEEDGETEFKDCVEDCEDTRKAHKTSIEFDADSGKVRDAAIFIGCPYDEDGFIDEAQVSELEDKIENAGLACITDRSAYVGSGCLSAIHAHEFSTATSNPDNTEQGPDVCWYHVRARSGTDKGTVADLSEALDLKE